MVSVYSSNLSPSWHLALDSPSITASPFLLDPPQHGVRVPATCFPHTWQRSRASGQCLSSSHLCCRNPRQLPGFILITCKPPAQSCDYSSHPWSGSPRASLPLSVLVPWSTTSSPWFYSMVNSSFLSSFRMVYFRMLCCSLIPTTLLWAPCSLNPLHLTVFSHGFSDQWISKSLQSHCNLSTPGHNQLPPTSLEKFLLNLLASLWLFFKLVCVAAKCF